MVFFSPPYATKAKRYTTAEGNSYPDDPKAWALYTAALMTKAAVVCDGVVLCVADSPLDRKGQYRPAVERLAVHLAEMPSVRLLRPPLWNKNGPPGSEYWPTHCYEWLTACCRSDIARPHYDWRANAAPARFDSGPGRQRNASGVRKGPAAKGVKKGSLARPSDVIRITVGGSHMGLVGTDGKIDRIDDRLATSGEAPYPWRLANWFVRSFSKPDDTILDFTVGTGTTALAAVMNGRNFVGGDIRRSQIDIAVRRLSRIGVTPEVIDGSAERSPG